MEKNRYIDHCLRRFFSFLPSITNGLACTGRTAPELMMEGKKARVACVCLCVHPCLPIHRFNWMSTLSQFIFIKNNDCGRSVSMTKISGKYFSSTAKAQTHARTYYSTVLYTHAVLCPAIDGFDWKCSRAKNDALRFVLKFFESSNEPIDMLNPIHNCTVHIHIIHRPDVADAAHTDTHRRF